MTSRKDWIICDHAGVENAVSFQELAELVARSESHDDLLIRRVDSKKFDSVDSVIGLERAVFRIRSAAVGVPSGSRLDAITERSSSLQTRDERNDTRPAVVNLPAWKTSISGWFFLSGMFICTVMVMIQYEQWRRFPTERDVPWLEYRCWWPLIGETSSIEFLVLLFDTMLIFIVVWACLNSRASRK